MSERLSNKPICSPIVDKSRTTDKDEQAMSIIKPSIGRKVWFWPAGFRGVKVMSDLQACDATIVYVWSDNMVNLLVTDHNGASISMPSVRLRQGKEPAPPGCYAEWMPFQLGQALPAPNQAPGWVGLPDSILRPPYRVGSPPLNVVTCTQASVDQSCMQPDTKQIKAY